MCATRLHMFSLHLKMCLFCGVFWAMLCALGNQPWQAYAAEAALPAKGAVTAQEGMYLIESLQQSLHILDVRTDAEFADGHIPHAQHIPLQNLEQRLAEVPADKPLLIVCRTGRRAQIAFEFLQQMRPQQAALWYLRAKPQYASDGTYSFR